MNGKLNTIEKTGKTIDEAIELALAELGVTRDRIDYEILEVPSKGLFGFIGSKLAKVKVTVRAVDPVEEAKQFLTKVFKAMNITVSMEKMTHDEHVVINLRGEDLGVLIGKHGQTLDALQYLTNLAANRDVEERSRIVLDVEDYRKRRAETLSRLAMRLADKVKRRGERVVLEPMSPQERKIIHMTLQNDHKIVTYSEGDEPYRKVVIALKK
ncbi:RNA-binding cell elongation regulator Jag/EloR [Sporomusa acidovorans]|uniref:RNA-binding protein KhpB n=1 Tax=Sporomusa acidovorans (strain ATCC 49682 / DSM 3132 / Mol) TaxID=1123286 RepID=A0ABZ3JBX3_SPOA4|nr:RNA-binding cell elongation regulator Jag/EloR [Sporomusa acidovorans]OZC22654.1 R3H domain protein [Sporomusa acidovorans DSM 3132]SDE77117.1 spoIIIJ-associated protein [Sporomusa acidovorans]